MLSDTQTQQNSRVMFKMLCIKQSYITDLEQRITDTTIDGAYAGITWQEIKWCD